MTSFWKVKFPFVISETEKKQYYKTKNTREWQGVHF